MENTSLHKNGIQLGAVTFHKKSSFESVQMLELSSGLRDLRYETLTLAGETLRARGSSAHAHHRPHCMDFNCPSRSALQPTVCLGGHTLSGFWLGFTNRDHQQEFRRIEEIKVEMPPGISLESP